jgi:hypothetical protein
LRQVKVLFWFQSHRRTIRRWQLSAG